VALQCVRRAISPQSTALVSVVVLLQVWRCSEAGWGLEATLPAHSDWVRDAVWAPNLGLPLNTIASAGQDGQVSASCSADVICSIEWVHPAHLMA
jgi:WD40 repeat protein